MSQAIRIRCPICLDEPVIDSDAVEFYAEGQEWKASFTCTACGPVVKELIPAVVRALVATGAKPFRVEAAVDRLEAVRDIGDLGWEQRP